MGSFNAQLALENRLRNQWAAAWQNTKSVYHVFENSGSKEPEPPYLKFYVRHFNSEEKGYGGASILYRRNGEIIAQCFAQLGKGAKLARQIADAVVAVFEGQKFDSITCREGTVIEVGQDGNLFQVNARVLFDYDEVRTVN